MVHLIQIGPYVPVKRSLPKWTLRVLVIHPGQSMVIK